MTQGFGIAEEVIGRWLKRSGRRDEIVLATKVYQPMGPGPNGRRLSAYHIRRACEASLRRLNTDHIDLYQMHHVDRATPWEEIWQAMEQNPAVATAVVGAETPEELISDLGALSVQLDADVLTRLDEIWPGPGEAPQAYAW